MYAVFDDTPDPMGETIEEQAQGAVRELNYLFGLRGKQSLDVDIVQVESWVSKEALDRRYDLVIVDYGGVGFLTASAKLNIWKLCEYAKNHPSTLLIIWTGHTSEIYEDELESEYGNLTNITMRFRKSEMYEHINGTPAFKTKFERWFANAIADARMQDPRTEDWKIENIQVPGRK